MAGSIAILIIFASVEVWKDAIHSILLGSGSGLRNLRCPAFLKHVTIIVFCGLALTVSDQIRSQTIYLDLPLSAQTADLGLISDELSGITTNPRMAQVLEQVHQCLDKYPTSRLAVILGGAIIPQLFGKENPLPADWWYPPEIVTSPEVTLDLVVEATSGAEGHLVLFQEFDMSRLASAASSGAGDAVGFFDYPNGYASRLFDVIPGELVRCGEYLGRYRS